MTTEWKDITDEMMMRGCQATQREELERQIMSSLVPKNEREHWAAREIGSLREQLAHRDAEVVSLTNQRDYEYVRAENAEQERDQLCEQLAEREKQVVLLWDALAMWNVASENSEESELDDMACYCVPMPLFCDADEAMGDALAKVRKP